MLQVAKEKAATEKESFNRQISMSCSGSRRGGPDGWAVAGGNSLPQVPPKASDLLIFLTHHFRLVDKLVASALESKEAEVGR